MITIPTPIAQRIVQTLSSDSTTFKTTVVRLFQNQVSVTPAITFGD